MDPVGDAVCLIFFVNGQKVEVQNPSPRTTLLQYLRHTLYLTGTKEACGQGGCGACTVMLSVFDTPSKKIHNITANACLVPLCYLHGMAVTTVEGIGSTRGGLHHIQESLVKSHGMQCGFCTPGMVMSMYTLLKNDPNPTDDQLERGLEGNLCRCTGYRPIVEAFRTARENCLCGLGACQGARNKDSTEKPQDLPKPLNEVKNELTQDVIFPPELQLRDSDYKRSVAFRCNGSVWYRPSSLEELLELKARYPTALMVMGCNSVGFQIRKSTQHPQTIICGTSVPELMNIDLVDNGLIIGAGVSLAKIETTLVKIGKNIKEPRNRNINAILKTLRWLAADQIRNTATIGGHVMTKGTDLELQTVLMAVGGTLVFRSHGKESRNITFDGDFIQNGTARSEDVLISVHVPFTDEREYVVSMKQPQRRGFDFGIVVSCMYVRFQKDSDIVANMKIAFGGLASKPLLVKKSSTLAVQREWTDDLLSDVCDSLIQELNNDSFDDIKFRLTLACSFFFRFYQHVKQTLENAKSDTGEIVFPPSSGVQIYDVPEAGGKCLVWKPVANVMGESLVTGEAQFIDDIPSYQNELTAVLVTSKRAHARIKAIDASKALAMKGVRGFLDHRDFPNNNKYAMEEADNYIFAEDEVLYFGQAIGAVLAEDSDTARIAAQLVEVTYEDLEAIFTIDEAVEKSSFYKEHFAVNHGDVDEAFKEADFVIEGQSQSGAVEHFYLEPQSAIVIPKKEQGEVEVLSSTQSLVFVQDWVANCLGIPRNRVLAKVKRCGGGFGGKLFCSIGPVGVAAVGAWKTNRPVRCVYDRATDFHLTGKRHPSKMFYKVCFNKTGRILGIDAEFYLNAGCSSGISLAVLKIAMLLFMSGYNIPNAREIGRICRTNTTSNTAFRGFGGPQAYLAMENIIQSVAHKLEIPPEKVREVNMMREGDTNPFKKTMTDDNLHRCWQECKELSNYRERTTEIKGFNSTNRWKKKGIAMTTVMFPVGFPGLHMNQAGALVMAYLDGSVLLAHGGIEIGQGIHTKAVQVAATVLDIPMDKVIVGETSTGTVPNTSETGGTFASELNAGAVAVACRNMMKRLEPYKMKNPDGMWKDWVKAAYMDRVSLSATGWFKTSKNRGYDFSTNTGDLCQYFTYGAACSEVEIDCLTGEHQINRTDIVMDIGKSLNPAVNIGQIEGGFVQGCGMLTTEKIYLTSEGRMISSGPLNYKIPGVRNIPREFRVKLLKDSEGDKEVYSSKGTGEPPLYLSMSVYQALKQAVLAARKESNFTDNFHLTCPATVEVIRMACLDDIIRNVEKSNVPNCKNTRITV